MEDGGDEKSAVLSLDKDEPSGRARSGSSSSGHRRSLSGSLLSKLSFLRMSQTTSNVPERGIERDGGDEEGLSTRPRGGRAMASALQQQQQQQRRTRRRRGSLRKTALLGTRFDSREKKAATSSRTIDVLRDGLTQPPPQPQQQQQHHQQQHLATCSVSPAENDPTPRKSFDHNNSVIKPSWSLQQKPLTSALRHLPSSMLGEETTTDDEDVVTFPRLNNNNTARSSSIGTNDNNGAGLHIPTPSSSSDSYFPLSDPTARQHRPVHRTKSPLAAHPVEIKNTQDITWDYSETEWWGWIILIVTWLVFVVGMGSCFGVWSWAWDVGETPYAPPELEDDPTLPIVGYYPALIILTAVMSWVWVVVAWVGMKYFKHANISGEDI